MVLRSHRNVKCTTRGFSSCKLPFARRKNASREKNMIDQGPIFNRPTAVLQSAKCQEIWLNNRLPPRQTDKKLSEGEWEGTPPSLWTQVSVRATIWGGIWGVICIGSEASWGDLVAPSGETRKSRPGLIWWVMRIPGSQTLGAEWRILVVGQTYLSFHPRELCW